MARCPHCAADVPAGSRDCPGCGAVQSSVSQAPTALGPHPPSAGTRPSAPSAPPRSGSPAPIGRPLFALRLDE